MQYGILALTSGAADSAAKADWHALSGRRVIIWRDNDEAGQKFAQAVLSELLPLGCNVWQVDIDQLALPVKGDVVDWLSRNPNATRETIEALPLIKPQVIEIPQRVDSFESEKEDEKKTSQATTIVHLALEEVELFVDRNSIAYAHSQKTKETQLIGGRQFRIGWYLFIMKKLAAFLVINLYEKR